MTDEFDDMLGESTTPKTETSKARKAKARPKPKARDERGQSTIPFPYQDLENAISVAKAIYRGGGVAITRDQLAGIMQLSSGSGNFVLKVSSARMFGLINGDAGRYELSDLGFRIVESDENKQKAARAEAFLKVPLYKRAYEEFRGKPLPPRPLGLEAAFGRFGVAPKQTGNARLIFDKSATQAGYYLNGMDRLIEPIIGGGVVLRPVVDEPPTNGDRQPQHASRPERTLEMRPTLHPFIQGLLETLPEPQTNWTLEGRAKWLQAAANIFDLIYKGSGIITISTIKGDPTPSDGA